MTDKPRLLMVDDDAELCELLGDYLTQQGFDLDFAHDAMQATEMLTRNETYRLMILDVMMPQKTGLELLQEIRPKIQLPVIMLTGRGEDIDRILGLEMGADDYLSKPCNPRELLARIRAILRRSTPQQRTSHFPEHCINHLGIQLDPGTREVRVQQQSLELTGTEFNVLAYLLASAGTIISKEQLTEWVLHRKLATYDRAIDVHVSRVRQKLAHYFNDQELIKTIRGVGYQFIRGE